MASKISEPVIDHIEIVDQPEEQTGKASGRNFLPLLLLIGLLTAFLLVRRGSHEESTH